ncbi:MAG: hypothetical protein WCF84_24225 [Anaerolineae bacterium]
MTPESIINLIRDVLVIGYLFILRIGVPILITLMVGTWLRKLLEEKQERPETKDAPEIAPATIKIKPQ